MARCGTPRTAARQGQLLPRARRRGRELRDGLLQVGIRQTIVIVFIYFKNPQNHSTSAGATCSGRYLERDARVPQQPGGGQQPGGVHGPDEEPQERHRHQAADCDRELLARPA